MAPNEDYLKILRILRKNSRQRLIRISEETGIPLQDVFEIYDVLKNDLKIRNSALIDFRKLHYNIRSFIIISYKKNQKDIHILTDFLYDSPNVNNLSETENGLIMEVIFSSEKKYNLFLSQIKKFDIQGMDEYMIMEDILLEKFLS